MICLDLFCLLSRAKTLWKKRTENNFRYVSPQADVHNSKQLVKVYYSLAMK